MKQSEQQPMPKHISGGMGDPIKDAKRSTGGSQEINIKIDQTHKLSKAVMSMKVFKTY